MTLLITERDVEQMLSIRDAIPVMEDVFRMAGEGTAENPPRYRMPMKKGFMQFGPAALHARQVAGFKVWANFGSPLRQVWDFLYSMETGDLLAVIQAHSISKFRTAAATAVAVKHLSPPGALTIGMYGSGRQAEAQLEAVCVVRPIKAARVYSRTRDKLETFCRRMANRLQVEVVPAAEPQLAARDADIVVTITKYGLLRWDQVWNLWDVIVGRAPRPDFGADIVLFESHGLAIEDVAIAAKAYELASAQGLGAEISL